MGLWISIAMCSILLVVYLLVVVRSLFRVMCLCLSHVDDFFSSRSSWLCFYFGISSRVAPFIFGTGGFIMIV